MIKKVIDTMKNKKAYDIVTIDMKKSDIPLDFFVICSGNSNVQVKSIFADVLLQLTKSGVTAYRKSIDKNATWAVIDFIDVVVHIFQKDVRKFYDIENLWSDLPQFREKGE